jgi:GNAT superfamily N-acetyltransferase
MARDRTPVIRPISPDERPDWEQLWSEYLAFYGASQVPTDTEITWNRLHTPEEPMFALGAYTQDRLFGIVHYLFHRSFWTSEDYCYLQDLFVAENARGLGLGRSLIEAVVEKALEAGAGRVYWLTQEDNLAARALYDKVADRSGFIQYRKMI